MTARNELPSAHLEGETRPRVVTETRYRGLRPTLACFCGSRGPKSSAVPPPVRVLEAKQVGGYDAVVLEASSPEALSAWLVKHNYAQRPALTEWLAPYVAAGWKLSAFKLGHDDGGGPIRTRPVRMTFPTQRPFFPYREPADQRAQAAAERGRLLRVYFVASARYQGLLGSGTTWPGKAVWAGSEKIASHTFFALGLSKPYFMTVFEDTSSPRHRRRRGVLLPRR